MTDKTIDDAQQTLRRFNRILDNLILDLRHMQDDLRFNMKETKDYGTG